MKDLRHTRHTTGPVTKKKSRKGRARTLITKGLRTPPGNSRRKMRAPNSATRIPPTTTTQGRRGAGRRNLGSVAAEMDLVGCASPREKVLPPPSPLLPPTSRPPGEYKRRRMKEKEEEEIISAPSGREISRNAREWRGGGGGRDARQSRL